MDTINCHNLLFNTNELKLLVKDNVKIKNISNSSLTFYVENGEAYFSGHPLANVDPWLPLFENVNIHTVRLGHVAGRHLEALPANVRNVKFKDYDDLTRVADWLHNEHAIPSNKLLEYTGGYTDLTPVFNSKITEALNHFLVPLSQNINEFCTINPHLQTIGYDFDRQTDHNHLHNINREVVLWSSHNHSNYLASQKFPQYETRLLRKHNDSYFTRL